jgi:hypothetical protein
MISGKKNKLNISALSIGISELETLTMLKGERARKGRRYQKMALFVKANRV